MNDQEQKAETLNSLGWRLIEEDFEIRLIDIDRATGCQSEADLFRRQGQIMMINEILALKESVMAQLEDDSV